MTMTIALLPLLVSAAASAAEPPSQPACDAPEHRQFDFWLGRFEVRTPEDRLAGHNRIEATLGGCALTEHWTGARGSEGRSLNFYDRNDSRWHQVWIDDAGEPLYLSGGLVDGSMVLTGETPASDGGTLRQRITWTPLEDGRVRQHWQASKDGGETWQTLFDGYYARED